MVERRIRSLPHQNVCASQKQIEPARDSIRNSEPNAFTAFNCYPAFSSSIGNVSACFFTISEVIAKSLTFLLPGT